MYSSTFSISSLGIGSPLQIETTKDSDPTSALEAQIHSACASISKCPGKRSHIGVTLQKSNRVESSHHNSQHTEIIF